MTDAQTDKLKFTALHERHIEAGGRMVGFSGYALPVQYPGGILAEHNWTRAHASLFDVSHMGPSFLALSGGSGDAEADHAAIASLIEPLISGDVRGLRPGQVRYTLLLADDGGILDDLMVARSPLFAGSLFMVVNAGTKEADFATIAAAVGPAATLTRADDGALLAVQGPEAAPALDALIPGVGGLGFMTYAPFPWRSTRLIVSRSGYTGEDGFEILCERRNAHELWDDLLSDARVRPAGLGARDSLRLEAGLPLYGHDLDPSVSPVEAGLAFAISKRRRETGDLAGWTRLSGELAGTLIRQRVGLLVEGAPAREGAEILAGSGEVVGQVTSGGFSPTLGRAIALGFVAPRFAEPGTALNVRVRGRAQPASVTPLPFVPHRYVRTPKKLEEPT